MRSARHLAALALLASAGLSSCVVPLASADQNCVSYCMLLQGCGVSGAPSGDCNAWCTAFATDLDRVGCKTQFDDAASCVVGEGTCAAASCGSETQAFSACTQAFCMKNPSDPACPSGG
jgi:hypothetical protein